MVTANGNHMQREISAGAEEVDQNGRKIMRMPQRPGGGGSSRKTQTAPEVIAGLWSKSNEQMRRDWLALYAAILASGGDQTAEEAAAIADEAYFEFHARSNPSRYDTTAG